MKMQFITPGQQRQVQLLGIDAEAVSRPQLDDLTIVFINIGFIPQGSHRLIFYPFQLGIHIIGLHRIIQIP